MAMPRLLHRSGRLTWQRSQPRSPSSLACERVSLHHLRARAVLLFAEHQAQQLAHTGSSVKARRSVIRVVGPHDLTRDGPFMKVVRTARAGSRINGNCIRRIYPLPASIGGSGGSVRVSRCTLLSLTGGRGPTKKEKARPPSSSGLGHSPLTAKTGVRVPLGVVSSQGTTRD